MNILIIDDSPLFEKTAETFEKAALCRLAAQNFAGTEVLAKEFAKLGANVLLLRPRLSDLDEAFEFFDREGFGQILVPVRHCSKNSEIRLREGICFSRRITENFPCIAGLFRPDAVILGAVLPFAAFAAAKIAEASGAVLITELFCPPKELLLRLGAVSRISPVLTALDKATNCALKKSDGVLGLFPDAQTRFEAAKSLYCLEQPAPLVRFSFSKEAKSLRESIATFKDGGAFVLVYCGPLEKGFSIEELVTVCSGFGNKFALVFSSFCKEKEYIRRFVLQKGYTNVFFVDGACSEELSFVLSAADGIFVSESVLTKGLLPEHQRFFGAFLTGRPVIACAEKYSEFFRRAGGVIITKPKNKDSIRLGIKTLMEMTETDREMLGLACKDFAEKNSFSAFAKNCFSIIDNLVKQKEIKK